MKAMVIENEDLKIMLVNEYIEPNVSSIAIARTMNQALELLESESFDYLFLDHHLPDCKGSSFLPQLKEKHNKMKCISISNDYRIMYSYKALGYDDVFQFPFDKSIERIFAI
jgi:response regulator of citrate/malate metabolism